MKTSLSFGAVYIISIIMTQLAALVSDILRQLFHPAIRTVIKKTILIRMEVVARIAINIFISSYLLSTYILLRSKHKACSLTFFGTLVGHAKKAG